MNENLFLHRTYPGVCEALAGLEEYGFDWESFSTSHVVVLGEQSCAELKRLPTRGWKSHFPGFEKLFIRCDLQNGWERTFGGSWRADLNRSDVILLRPFGDWGWAIEARTGLGFPAAGFDDEWRFVLTEATSSDALIIVPDLKLAKALALHAVRRGYSGDVPSPLACIKWRGIPYEVEGVELTMIRRTAPALDHPIFDWLPTPYSAEPNIDEINRRRAEWARAKARSVSAKRTAAPVLKMIQTADSLTLKAAWK